MRFLAAMVLALAVSGCLSTPEAHPDTPAAPADLHFARLLDVSTACTDCYEPAAAVDPAGRIFVAAHRLGGVAVSEDGGQTFTIKPVPPPDSPLPTAGGASDDVVQVAPWGTLYYHELWSDGGGIAGAGIHIAASDDGGDTWHLNKFIHVREAPTSLSVTSDRQWLAFDGNDTVYLVFNGAASLLIYSLRSDDRGQTWSAPSVVVAPDEHTFPSPAGFPTVGPDGALIVPYFADPRPDGSIGARSVKVAASLDGGRTFQQHTVHTHPLDGGASGGGWPEATILANNTWVAGWSTMDDRLMFAFSEDHGATWSTPVSFGADVNGGIGGHPWLLPRSDGGLDAVWFASGPSVHLGRMAPDGSWTFATVPEEGGGSSDYPYFAHDGQERVVTPFMTDEGLRLAISNA